MAEQDNDNASHNDRPWQSYHTVYTNAKSGMDGVDKEKVQRIVYEMSKGSKYFENEERKEGVIRQKIENMRALRAKLSDGDIRHFQKVADKKILELEAKRDLSRIWLHVDMDAFYAAVETLSNPSLKDRPMAVGSMSMISTANYEARKYGVRAAMPGFIAHKLCPELILVPTDFKKYTYYSDLTRKVFQSYDPNFMAASLDEAYLDITEVCKERGITSEQIAEELRASVYEETGLTCSAGVAPNRLLAKVCSDIKKPNGQFVLPNDHMAVITFISSLPIRKIGGIGKVTERILKDVFGINTCEDIRCMVSYLCALFSSSTADFFLAVGLGIGSTDSPQVKFRKSISNERTFSATEDESLLFKRLAELAELLSGDMQKEGLCGRTLTLKLKTASFEVRTRAVTLEKYITTSEDILKHASKLLRAELPISLRLMGLRVSQLNEEKFRAPPDPTQKTLTSFITSGDGFRNARAEGSSFPSYINDHDFVSVTETDTSIQRSDCYIVNNVITSEKNCNSLTGENSDEVCTFISFASKSDDNAVSQLPGSNISSIPEEFQDCCLGGVNSPTNLLSERLPSLDQGATMMWLEDYKCSLCGIELPPSFVEERQEHSDFHLAQKIQEEESRRLKASMPRPSGNRGEQIIRQRKPKKQKSSQKEGRYVPIDLFFGKSNRSL